MKDRRLLYFLVKAVTSALVFDILQRRIQTEGIKSGLMDDQMLENGFDPPEEEIFNNNSLIKHGDGSNSSDDLNSLDMVYLYGYDGNMANLSRDKFDMDEEQMFRLSNNKLLNIRKEIINDAWNDVINFKSKIKPVASRFKYNTGGGNRSREGRVQALVNQQDSKHRRPFTFVRIEKRRILDYSFVSGEIKDEQTGAVDGRHDLKSGDKARSLDGGDAGDQWLPNHADRGHARTGLLNQTTSN